MQPTSALDVASEAAVQESIDRMVSLGENQQTCITVAHRLSTIRDADVIFVMQDGEIVERGDHETLMAMRGVYHELVNHQQCKLSIEPLWLGSGQRETVRALRSSSHITL